MSVTDASLAALLLGNRIVDVGQTPLTASEFWALCERVDDISVLLGMPAAEIARVASVPADDARRYAALLGAGTAFAFERERLADEGVRLISALDDEFPARLRRRLGTACPSFLLVAGPTEFLEREALAVVGSRNASPVAVEVAGSVARIAAAEQRVVVSGVAHGVDHASVDAALDVGVPVVGVPDEGMRVVARRSEIRRRAHSGELCIISPYSPAARATTANAMGRNKLIYGLAEVTLVVCTNDVSGGTWRGAHEATVRGFGRVAVWTGPGAGLENANLLELGGVAVDDVGHLADLLGSVPNPTDKVPPDPTPGPDVVTQPTLFD